MYRTTRVGREKEDPIPFVRGIKLFFHFCCPAELNCTRYTRGHSLAVKLISPQKKKGSNFDRSFFSESRSFPADLSFIFSFCVALLCAFLIWEFICHARGGFRARPNKGRRHSRRRVLLFGTNQAESPVALLHDERWRRHCSVACMVYIGYCIWAREALQVGRKGARATQVKGGEG